MLGVVEAVVGHYSTEAGVLVATIGVLEDQQLELIGISSRAHAGAALSALRDAVESGGDREAGCTAALSSIYEAYEFEELALARRRKRWWVPRLEPEEVHSKRKLGYAVIGTAASGAIGAPIAERWRDRALREFTQMNGSEVEIEPTAGFVIPGAYAGFGGVSRGSAGVSAEEADANRRARESFESFLDALHDGAEDRVNEIAALCADDVGEAVRIAIKAGKD